MQFYAESKFCIENFKFWELKFFKDNKIQSK